jgi:hypothetical protein
MKIKLLAINQGQFVRTFRDDFLYSTVLENVTCYGLYDHFQANDNDAYFAEFKLAET